MEGLTEPDLGPVGSVQGETPALRLFALLEFITTRDQLFTLQSLVDQTGIPKPTLHRMLQQLESADLLMRQSDGKHYGTGARMRRMAEDVLLNDTRHGSRHAVLKSLVDQIGESCNITALSGNEVIYLDRVETTEPLRIHLGPGSRVPVHCSASGKMILSQFGPAQRERVIAMQPLKVFTRHTQTNPALLEEELRQIRLDGYALDREEFLDGLVCIAVLVPNATTRSNMCVAVQAPIVRMSSEDLVRLLPSLRAAAETLGRIEEQQMSDGPSLALSLAGG
ncbi:IclR family transcriptional regulator [Arthrobacter crystallopoietes]|uniref:IclR family transcriptional regulator n=1 Tax=Crystallibacter crystallopoietes TaxID=37928 RepID=UPI0011116036|nr:IclR family transcriptional regulator [Arthrobacter crystallopoietes]